ncbi:MAG: tripartite tricarboxylate transporter substrate binding protein [Trueperaceae bacterium]
MIRGIIILFVALTASALAQFPERPINYIVSFDPGGESDITARLQQEHLEEILGVRVTITNQAGGGGAVAWSNFQRNPDTEGYSVIGINLPHIVTQPMERANAGFDTYGFEILTIFQFTPSVVLVREDSPFETLDDLLAFARENPGAVTMGGSGTATVNHIDTMLLADQADVQITYVPFTGTGSAVPALLGGHVGALMNYSTVAAQYADQVRPLAIAGSERASFMQDTPTFEELGFENLSGAYRGVAVAQGTPEDVVQTLRDAFVEAGSRIADEQEELGFVVTNITGEEATQLLQETEETYSRILEDLR